MIPNKKQKQRLLIFEYARTSAVVFSLNLSCWFVCFFSFKNEKILYCHCFMAFIVLCSETSELGSALSIFKTNQIPCMTEDILPQERKANWGPDQWFRSLCPLFYIVKASFPGLIDHNSWWILVTHHQPIYIFALNGGQQMGQSRGETSMATDIASLSTSVPTAKQHSLCPTRKTFSALWQSYFLSLSTKARCLLRIYLQ